LIARLRWRGVAAGAILALLVGAALARASSTGGSATPGLALSHTFIDLVQGLPSDLDETATPESAQIELEPSWSSELVRPAPATPGPNAKLPSADAVVPYLATSWQRSPNGDYTFHLRRGVRGPTGDLFTAADVQWSFERALAVSPVAPFLLALANVDTSDPVTILSAFAVRINVTAPSPLLLGVLADFDLGIYDRHVFLDHASAGDPWAERWGSSHSATFGAYFVSKFVLGKQIVLSANPGSWVHPYYTTVDIDQVPSSSTRLAAVLDSKADHTTDLAWSDFGTAVEDTRADHVGATILESGPLVESWLLNVTGGPLANPLVRRALNLAVDRADLNEAIYAGFAVRDTLAIPAIYGQSQPRDYDPAKARRLFAQAGYPHGLTLHLDVGTQIGDGDGTEEVHLLVAQLAEVVVKLVIATLTNPDQMLELEQAHQVPSTIEDIQPVLSGAAFLLIEDDAATLDAASPAAVDGYDDPALVSLLTQLRSTPAGPAAQALVARAAKIVDQDLPIVNLLAAPVQNVTRANIAGYAAYAVPVTYYEFLHPTLTSPSR
jgi:peptide/nickel transport system substrate-binding protein